MSSSKPYKKNLKPVWIVLVILALGALVWAAAEGLELQSNKSAANASNLSADDSLMSMDTIKKPQATAKKPAPPVDWNAEAATKKQLDQQEKTIKGLMDRGNNEQNASGAVSSGTANQLRSAGQTYLDTSKKYSEIWAKGNCKTRSRLALEAGETMMSSVEVMIAGADGDKIKELNSNQDELDKARRDYFKEVADSGELSDADKKDIINNVQPRANQLVTSATSLITQVTSLLDQIRSQVQGMASPDAAIGAVTACASGGGGAAADNIASRLLGPITSLLSLVKGTLGSAQSLISDIGLLK